MNTETKWGMWRWNESEGGNTNIDIIINICINKVVECALNLSPQILFRFKPAVSDKVHSVFQPYSKY